MEERTLDDFSSSQIYTCKKTPVSPPVAWASLMVFRTCGRSVLLSHSLNCQHWWQEAADWLAVSFIIVSMFSVVVYPPVTTLSLLTLPLYATARGPSVVMTQERNDGYSGGKEADLYKVHILLISQDKDKTDSFIALFWLSPFLSWSPVGMNQPKRLWAQNCIGPVGSHLWVDACGPAGLEGREIVSSVHRQCGCEKDKKNTQSAQDRLISERWDSTDQIRFLS